MHSLCARRLSGGAYLQVVAAVTEQMAVLNTNVRYLHSNLVQHAEALAASMPGPLEVSWPQILRVCCTAEPGLWVLVNQHVIPAFTRIIFTLKWS